MRARFVLTAAAVSVTAALFAQGAKPPAASPPAKVPVLTFETVKGTIVVETFPLEAPKSVEHILALVKRRFYDGTAVHRVVAAQLVQFGDQQSRNAQLKEWWGRGPNSGSGNPIGVAEISKKRTHKRGSLSLAHSGNPAAADSQMFFALKAAPQWDGKYTVIGQVTEGLDLIAKLQVGDRIKKVTVSSP
jgi:cyclophilin family peptidyl-prolyl cis-trans isomerase